jgi:hypothetical protein
LVVVVVVQQLKMLVITQVMAVAVAAVVLLEELLMLYPVKQSPVLLLDLVERQPPFQQALQQAVPQEAHLLLDRLLQLLAEELEQEA